jgi:hypothetical protein
MSRVITFSRYFPKSHPKAGKPTFFVEKIYKSLFVMKCVPSELVKDFNFAVMNDDEYLPKHHTVRNGSRWKVGDKFSPRVWSGKPYNSKQIIISSDITITKVYNITILVLDFGKLGLQAVVSIDGKFFDKIETLSMNDGLFVDDFLNWFLNKKEETFVGQIICWSDVKY